MPYDKDDEFEMFYDFSRAYRDLPQKPMIKAAEETDAEAAERRIEKNQRMASKSDKKSKSSKSASGESGSGENDNESSDDWEDIDCDDGDMEDVEEANSEEEESSEQPSNEESKSSASSDFVVLSNNNDGASAAN
eukprot:CAMPEP_0170472288 /NCGR_PEP_ID=MMETSP0123-20130129/14347_1 /TAXON_ID=182087 /ORGANISM="Favella ehrenbergii, Strain Fehren 1" /LENGTH=134 /DNA_ID=CAMNT_0010740465 /DNA_START=799 /DNA_END=1203 /DNA_ORIENTATION=-